MTKLSSRLIVVLGLAIQLPALAYQADFIESYQGGFVERYPGGLVIHVKGCPYEMGVQYGYLVGDQLNVLIPLLKTRVEEIYGIPLGLFDVLRDVAVMVYQPYFPQSILEELEGIIDGAELRIQSPLTFGVNDLIAVNAIIDAIATFDLDSIFCSGFAAWGPLTVDGKTFSTRNIDLLIGYGLESYTAVTVVKEEGKVPIANIGFIGMIGCVSGMSARGLSFSQIWGYSKDIEFGTPWPLTARAVLQVSDDVQDAVTIFTTAERTYGSNFVFSDGRRGTGVCIETSANHIAHFFDNDPRELAATFQNSCYAIMIPNAVFRASPVMDPTLRSLQYSDNGPDGDPRTSGAYRNRYKGQADRILAYRDSNQLIGVDEAMTISRQVAMRGSSMQCVVYANTDLEFWAAYSYIDAAGTIYDACDRPYHHFQFYRYLPTIIGDLNQTRYRPGDHLTYKVRTSNLGPARDLDLYLAFSVKGVLYFYPAFTEEPSAVKLSLDADEMDRTRIELSAALGFDVQPGTYTFIAALVDPGTGALIDIDEQRFSIWR